MTSHSPPIVANPQGKLAILDYGIGGLECWQRIKRRHPKLSTIYLSDSGFTPYGQLTEVDLRERLYTLSSALKRRGASTLVIACNAASSVLPHMSLDLPTQGIIESALDLVNLSGFKRVGVIGGQRTIESCVYHHALTQAGIQVVQRIAQPLSACIESGDLDSPTLHMHLHRITAPLRDQEAVLLACTHYPAITGLIQLMLPQVTLLNPVDMLIEHVERRWKLKSFEQGSTDQILTTGSKTIMMMAAQDAFSVSLPGIDQVSLDLQDV